MPDNGKTDIFRPPEATDSGTYPFNSHFFRSMSDHFAEDRGKSQAPDADSGAYPFIFQS